MGSKQYVLENINACKTVNNKIGLHFQNIVVIYNAMHFNDNKNT